jgi:hypothetical protein
MTRTTCRGRKVVYRVSILCFKSQTPVQRFISWVCRLVQWRRLHREREQVTVVQHVSIQYIRRWMKIKLLDKRYVPAYISIQLEETAEFLRYIIGAAGMPYRAGICETYLKSSFQHQSCIDHLQMPRAARTGRRTCLKLSTYVGFSMSAWSPGHSWYSMLPREKSCHLLR